MDAKTLCLGALMCGDASGYEIRKLYEEGPFSAFYRVGFGSIYPALNRLLAEGLATITQPEAEQGRRPGKKVYSITSAGRTAFAEALRVAPEADRFRSDRLFILFFGELLPAMERTALLDAYAAQHEAKVKAFEACALEDTACSPGHLFIRTLGQAVSEAIVRTIAENRHLLEPSRDEPAGRQISGGESKS